MRPLSQRLSLIASFAEKGKNICDVGTDHGYLSAYLSLSGEYGCITATDINEKPLMNAKKNLEKLGIKNVKLVLCDGLSGVTEQEAQNVIIAGMGGEVIAGIISKAPFLKSASPRIILQPTTAAFYLREYLAHNGFSVEEESAVEENKKLYSVMAVRFTGEKRSLSECEKRIGILDTKKEVNIRYIKKQLNICEKCAKDLEGIKDKEEEYKKAYTCAKELKAILEDKNGI